MVGKVTGRNTKTFEYSGAEFTVCVVVVGAVLPVMEESVDSMPKKGEKVGLIAVHLYRPWSAKHFLAAPPKMVKKIALLDQTKEVGSFGEPFFLDVATSLLDAQIPVVCVGGRYGLGTKGFTLTLTMAVFVNPAEAAELRHSRHQRRHRPHLAPCLQELQPDPQGGAVYVLVAWLGRDGQREPRLDQDHRHKHGPAVQRYFSYDAHKSGGVTVSHLRIGKQPSKAQHLILNADYTACHIPNSVKKYNVFEAAKPASTFVLNCAWDMAALEKQLPGSLKRVLRRSTSSSTRSTRSRSGRRSFLAAAPT